MNETLNKNQHKFDLEERTTEFAKKVIRLCRKLPKHSLNVRLISQLVSSAGSIGANYREANDCLGAKDFSFRLKIARKEAKETIYWLDLLKEANQEFKEEIQNLIKEAQELKNIFSSIIKKFKST